MFELWIRLLADCLLGQLGGDRNHGFHLLKNRCHMSRSHIKQCINQGDCPDCVQLRCDEYIGVVDD